MWKTNFILWLHFLFRRNISYKKEDCHLINQALWRLASNLFSKAFITWGHSSGAFIFLGSLCDVLTLNGQVFRCSETASLLLNDHCSTQPMLVLFLQKRYVINVIIHFRNSKSYLKNHRLYATCHFEALVSEPLLVLCHCNVTHPLVSNRELQTCLR